MDKILDAWKASDQATANNDLIAQVTGSDGQAPICTGEFIPKEHYTTPFGHQFSVLSRRGFVNTLRNPLVIWLRMGLYVMLSIMIGTIWLQIGAGDPKSNVVQDIASALFFITAFMVFMSVAVQIAYVEEKELFHKERAAGMYSTLPFTLAHTVVDAPFLMLLLWWAAVALVGTLCVFFVQDLQFVLTSHAT